MKAVKKFKRLLSRRRTHDVLGLGAERVKSPLSMDGPDLPALYKARSVDTDNRTPVEQMLAREGVHHVIDVDPPAKHGPQRGNDAFFDASGKRRLGLADAEPELHQPVPRRGHPEAGKGQAHDPSDDLIFLAVGPWGGENAPDPPAVSESPPAAEPNIYERAYDEEVERIRAKQGRAATLFLTRRVDSSHGVPDSSRGRPGSRSTMGSVVQQAMRAGTPPAPAGSFSDENSGGTR